MQVLQNLIRREFYSLDEPVTAIHLQVSGFFYGAEVNLNRNLCQFENT